VIFVFLVFLVFLFLLINFCTWYIFLNPVPGTEIKISVFSRNTCISHSYFRPRSQIPQQIKHLITIAYKFNPLWHIPRLGNLPQELFLLYDWRVQSGRGQASQWIAWRRSASPGMVNDEACPGNPLPWQVRQTDSVGSMSPASFAFSGSNMTWGRA
jgi:hypothetical protein